jgi:hypothetical protein
VGHAIFLNLSGTGFQNVATQANVVQGFPATAGVMGCQLGDISGDGVPDIYVGNGGPPGGQTDQLFIADSLVGESPHFQDETVLIDFTAPVDTAFPGTYPPYPYRTHGTVFTDVDLDGSLEIAVVNGGPSTSPDTVREPNRLFKLDITPRPGYLKIRPVGNGTTISRDAIGTRVAVTVSTLGVPRTMHRTLFAGSAFSAQNGFELHFYTGDADTVDSVQITWPGGTVEVLTQQLALNSSIVVSSDPAAGEVPDTLTLSKYGLHRARGSAQRRFRVARSAAVHHGRRDDGDRHPEHRECLLPGRPAQRSAGRVLRIRLRRESARAIGDRLPAAGNRRLSVIHGCRPSPRSVLRFGSCSGSVLPCAPCCSSSRAPRWDPRRFRATSSSTVTRSPVRPASRS